MAEHTSASDISRRELMRRGAALGAAVAVASPVVQGLGRMSAFAQVTPPPDAPPGSGLPSHFQMVVTFGDNGTRYGIKWDQSWGGLGNQGNVCWSQGDAVHPFERAGNEQLSYFDNSMVTATSRGYEVNLPSAVSVVDAAATFDGSNCFFSGSGDGPYQDGSTWVFPKPSGGQGGGGGAGA